MTVVQRVSGALQISESLGPRTGVERSSRGRTRVGRTSASEDLRQRVRCRRSSPSGGKCYQLCSHHRTAQNSRDPDKPTEHLDTPRLIRRAKDEIVVAVQARVRRWYEGRELNTGTTCVAALRCSCPPGMKGEGGDTSEREEEERVRPGAFRSWRRAVRSEQRFLLERVRQARGNHREPALWTRTRGNSARRAPLDLGPTRRVLQPPAQHHRRSSEPKI